MPRAPQPRPAARPTMLRLAPPPIDHEPSWRRIMNLLYLHEQDQLFAWLRGVRAAGEEAEKKGQQRRAA